MHRFSQIQLKTKQNPHSNEVANSCHHEYEDIKLCSYLDVHEDDDKIQQCLAYGVNDKRN